MPESFPEVRLRRLRQNLKIRNLVSETNIKPKKLILPLFIKKKKGEKIPIISMPGHYQIPINLLKEEIKELSRLKVEGVILFGIPDHKDENGSDSYDDQGIIQCAIHEIKSIAPNILIISDVCLCEYTVEGHCGVIKEKNNKIEIENDISLELLAKQAVSHARAGADIVAPSAMMDGMVRSIRSSLDKEGFSNIPILSYSVKYFSSLYAPFRAAAEGAPKRGDRSSYQMDPSNVQEALREVKLDVEEGVDMIIVKPAHTYLDVINRVKNTFPSLPLGAYHTSGEFSFIKAAAEKGLLNERQVVFEVLTSIYRAGADFIITYYAKDFAKWALKG